MSLDYIIRWSSLRLSDAESAYLKKHYDWLVRLESGEIVPGTELQKQFLKVLAGEISPQEPHERLWVRVKQAREIAGAVKARVDELSSMPGKLGVEWWELNMRQGHTNFLESEQSNLYATCKQCNGDGGAGGRCPRCGGNGMEPRDA